MDARHRDVLIAIIREYVDSAEPVGSRVLTRRHFPTLSPATIRNVMAELEETGYLAQPHTSAGRVPTDKAYRFYVNSFPPAQAAEAPPAPGTLPTRRSGIDGFMERTSAPSDPLDTLHTRARAVTEQIVALLKGRTLYVSGAINMLDHPEFWDIETTRDLLRTFEQKERLADLMTVLAEGEGLRVTIGEENPYSEMRECTLITSTYLYHDQVVGILGVVGPRRLPYPDVISVVNETARHVTEALSRVRQDLYLPS